LGEFEAAVDNSVSQVKRKSKGFQAADIIMCSEEGIKGQVPDEPDEAFGCGMLLFGKLIVYKALQSFGLCGLRELAVANFL
jgi:hypothetical protein